MASPLTPAVCPLYVRRCRPVSPSQTWTVPSAPPEATRFVWKPGMDAGLGVLAGVDVGPGAGVLCVAGVGVGLGPDISSPVCAEAGIGVGGSHITARTSPRCPL